jgi:hypothetical protein
MRSNSSACGGFDTRNDFDAAIPFDGDVHATLGRMGGFRGADMKVIYDRVAVGGRFCEEDQHAWLEFFQPLAKWRAARLQITNLPSARRKKACPTTPPPPASEIGTE